MGHNRTASLGGYVSQMGVGYRDLSDSLLLKAFGYSPKLRIIDICLTNPYFDFSRQELARELGMSKQTLFRDVKDLEELGIVVPSRRIGRATLYRINREHPLVRRLDEIITETSVRLAATEAKRQPAKLLLKAAAGR